MLTFMNSKLTKMIDKDNQNHIFQKSKPYEISSISSIRNMYPYIHINIYLSFSTKNFWFFSEFLCSISSSHFWPFNSMCAFNR